MTIFFLETMFVKYTAIVNRESNKDKGDDEDYDNDTVTIEQVAIWQNIIDKSEPTLSSIAQSAKYLFFAVR
jgi:hypothetical protein